MAAALEAAPIEKLAVDAETLGNLTLALGSASAHHVPGVTSSEATELDKDLDSNRVKQRQGMSYLTEHDVVRTANRIFGFGRWGTEVVSHELIGSTFVKNSKGEEGWYTGYRCTVRLSVAGCLPVDGVGYGDAFEKQWSGQITTHELAVKEAESDAIKRAFKKFGDQFGLILYAKADDKKRIDAEKAEAAYNAPAEQGDVDELRRILGVLGKSDAAIVKEVGDHGVVRAGWLARQLDRARDAAANGEPKPTPEPTPEPAATTAATDRKQLPDGQRAVTEEEITALLDLVKTQGPDAVAKTRKKIVDMQAKMEAQGYGAIAPSEWFIDLSARIVAKIGEQGGDVSRFKPPASATKQTTDDDVAAAFAGEQAA